MSCIMTHTVPRDSALKERMKYIKHLAKKDSSVKRKMEVCVVHCPLLYSDIANLFKAKSSMWCLNPISFHVTRE